MDLSQYEPREGETVKYITLDHAKGQKMLNAVIKSIEHNEPFYTDGGYPHRIQHAARVGRKVRLVLLRVERNTRVNYAHSEVSL